MPIVVSVTITVPASANLTDQDTLDPERWSREQTVTYTLAHAMTGIICEAFRKAAQRELNPTEVRVDVKAQSPIAQNAPQISVVIQPMDIPGILENGEDICSLVTGMVTGIAFKRMDLTTDGIIIELWPMIGYGMLIRPGLPTVTW